MLRLGKVAKNVSFGRVSTQKGEKKGGAGIHPKKDFCCGDGYFGQKKFAEKVRKSRQNVNRDKSA